jgi:energy-coupling factor transporter ATP-binding protein EcfA2
MSDVTITNGAETETVETNSTYTYSLPQSGESGTLNPMTTNVNSIVIIGANGSGKSRLGAWIESKSRVSIHRIGAQRSLCWRNDEIIPKSFEVLSNRFLYGGEYINEASVNNNFNSHKDGKTTTERRDIDAILSSIFAKRTAQLEAFDELLKAAPNQTLPREDNIVDDIQEIWDSVFPHRELLFKDLKVFAKTGGSEYNGVEMSDGERVALYLIAQVLMIPKNRTIIIDEPEIHLHRSIMNRLWTAIEKARPDCLFVFITHDTEFAATHKLSDKIWCKSYDGTNWEWEKVGKSALPDDLLLKLLGNRKSVLFVEGTENSDDTKLYQALYKDYFIVPCGSCHEVIQRTKAYKATSQLNHLQAYGLIDRDFRCEAEITALRSSGVYVLKVAEVENLFIVREVFSILNTHFAKENQSAINGAISCIIDTKFNNMKTQQVRKATIAELKYQFSIIDISGAISDEDVANKVAEISYSTVQCKITEKYQTVYNNRDYNEILKLFNEKELAKNVGKFFGCKNDEYCPLVIRLASGGKADEFRNALKPYLPNEIPLTTKEDTDNA